MLWLSFVVAAVFVMKSMIEVVEVVDLLQRSRGQVWK